MILDVITAVAAIINLLYAGWCFACSVSENDHRDFVWGVLLLGAGVLAVAGLLV